MQIKGIRRQSQAEDPIAHLSQLGQWQEIKTSSNIIARRCCHSASIYNDNLYIYGGYDSNSSKIFNDMFAYSFTQKNWKKIDLIGCSPGPRHSHTSVIFGNLMILFGGMTNIMSNCNELNSYDFDRNQWKKIKSKNYPSPIDSHRACIYQDKMIVGLGYTQNDYNSKIYSLDLKNWEWNCIFNPKKLSNSQYPSPRAHGSFNILKNSIYIYGGKDFSNIFNDFWKFDLQSKRFSKINLINPLSGRSGHLGVVYNNKIFIFGGTKGVTHEKNDLISIDVNNRIIRTYWTDTQEQKINQKEEQSPLIKKSRRDSVKKLGAESHDSENNETNTCSESSSKYRNKLREVNYYNNLYENHKKQNDNSKKAKRNPLLTELQGPHEIQSLNLTSTFEILTNSIMLTMGKTPSKGDRNDAGYENFHKSPKARDNYSANLLQGNQNQLIIFGGGMHKISYNDLILIDLGEITKNQG